MAQNYQKELERTLSGFLQDQPPKRLLLHSCCAPCSSYVIEYLSSYFSITVFYYNPNIYPEQEYGKRAEEQREFIRRFPAKYPAQFLYGEFEPERFYEAVKGLEREKEGGERCFCCYRLRLEETAKMAKRLGMDYFTTTLSISPLKQAVKLNEIGRSEEHTSELHRKNMAFLILSRILRKKMGINVQWNCQRNMDCTVRTIAAAYFLRWNGNGKRKGAINYGTIMGRTLYEGNGCACLCV